jgi:hypothetical protein
VVTAAPIVPAAPTGPVFNPATQAALDNLRLNGVRLAGPDSRILLEGEVYNIGDIVETHDLKLKVFAVAPREIIFEDDSGAQYTKRF